MSKDPVVNLVLMTCHDYLYYASQDYGAVARPSEIVGNYALMYALNRHVPEVRRIVSEVKPHYCDDLGRMSVYATPAAMINDFPDYLVGGGKSWVNRQAPLCGTVAVPWSGGLPLRITWNSIGETLLDKMTQDNINLPKLGAYYRYPPLTMLYFYAIGGPIPSIIRVGKKFIPARLSAYPLEATRREGVFHPTCPVNVVDLPENTSIRSGSLLTIPPAPVLVAAELDGPYLECRDTQGLAHKIPLPKADVYRAVWDTEAG
ncbi:MAG: hypothetical protein QXS20_08590 [Candidatus Thorarchaeota archaeon]